MEKIRTLLNSKIFYILLAIIVALNVFINLSIPEQSSLNSKDTIFTGTLNDLKIDESKLQLELDLGKENLVCNYYLENGEIVEYGKYKLGSKIKIEGTLKEPLNNTVPNTFNYKKYLYYKDTFYTCTIKKIDILESKVNIFYKIKNAIVSRIMSFDIRDYLFTLIIGDKSLLDEEVYLKYRENGVSHLFAISGMHIGLFTGIILGLLKKLHVKERKRYILTILFIFFYAFLVGFSPSVMRACLLFTFGSINKFFKLEIPSFKVLLLVGACLILKDYAIVYDVGFIYSFTIVGGLMLSEKFIKKHKILGTSLVATLYSIPITASNFYSINLLGVFNNLIFVPLMTIIVYPLCLVTFLVRFTEPLAKMAISIMEGLSGLAYNVEFLNFVIPKMNPIAISIYYLLLIVFLNKKPLKTTALLLGIVFLTKLTPFMDVSYKIDFLDVGQGDSILIRSPQSKEVILVDTGGVVGESTYRPSQNTITYLHSLGINKIDTLILTHGDADHLGDALFLIDNIEIKEIILNRGENSPNEQLIIDSGVPIAKNYEGELELTFLNDRIWDDENSNSIVMYLKILNYKILLMGDAPSRVEEYILKKEPKMKLDILKAGHHGSKTSSSKSFIDSTQPKYAIISVGRKNRYGHPNKEVLDNLASSKIYRTDLDGTVQLKINKREFKISTCPP